MFRQNWLLSLAVPILAAAIASAAAAGELAVDTEKDFSGNAGVSVQGLRLGPHPDKLRIVLDATGPLNFDFWISEGGRTIVVLIPQVEWAAPQYLRLDQTSRIYRISFFPNPSGGGVLSILGRERLGLSAVEQIGPDRNRPYRVVFDIPVREADAWVPGGGIMRGGKLLPPHREWPPVLRAQAGRPLPVITRQSVADAVRPDPAVRFANR